MARRRGGGCGARHGTGDAAQGADFAAERHRIVPSHVLLTHHHHDHVVELPKIVEAAALEPAQLHARGDVLQGLDHVAHKLLNLLCFWIGDRLRLSLQHRMPHARDFQDRHRAISPFPFEIWGRIAAIGSPVRPSQGQAPVLHTAPINGRHMVARCFFAISTRPTDGLADDRDRS